MQQLEQRTLRQQLDEPYMLSNQAITTFRECGYIKLKHVLSPEVLMFYGAEITRLVLALNNQHKPMEERTTYERAFLQITNLWTQSEIAKEFAWSRRLAQIAAELMEVDGVRMYHDQALYKESGGGVTPWHADQYYWPVSGTNTITVWVPLQATPIDLGPLAFSVGSHHFEMGRQLAISDESEEQLKFSLRNLPIDESPYDLGEISYHYGWTFHRAAPNVSDKPRSVMTMIYLDTAAQLVAPKHQHQQKDWDMWMPNAHIGEVINTPLNPVLYQKI